VELATEREGKRRMLDRQTDIRILYRHAVMTVTYCLVFGD
jgi:hypothetical protein